MIYTVVGPDGQEHQIEGPEGASDEEIIAQAQSLLGSEQSVPFDLEKAVTNIIPSAKQAGSNILGALSHPGKTIAGLDELAMSGMANLFGNEDERTKQAGKEFAGAISDRYGSLEKFKRTLENDPTGALMDVAGALQLGGLSLGAIPKLSKAGKAVQSAGNLIDPVANAGRLVRTSEQALAKLPGLRNIPEKMYERATQFNSPELRSAAFERNINPMTDLESLQALKSGQGEKLAELAKSHPGTFAPETLTEGLYNNPQNFMAVPGVNTVSEVKAFQRFVDNLETTLGLKRPPIITQFESASDLPRSKSLVDPTGRPIYSWTSAAPQLSGEELHKFKTDAWSKIYGTRPPEDVVVKPGVQQARRHVASNAARALSEAIPEYGATAKEYGTLKDLVREIEPMAKRIKNTEEAIAQNADRFANRALTFGFAFGEPVIGSTIASSAYTGKLLNSPTRRISRALKTKQLRDMPFSAITQPSMTGSSPLIDLLNLLDRKRQEELRRQLAQ
jgi:hypothetical protein